MVLVKWKTQEMGEMWSGKLGNTISKSTVWGDPPNYPLDPLSCLTSSPQPVVPCSETILLSQAEQEMRGWEGWKTGTGGFLTGEEDS